LALNDFSHRLQCSAHESFFSQVSIILLRSLRSGFNYLSDSKIIFNARWIKGPGVALFAGSILLERHHRQYYLKILIFNHIHVISICI